MDKYICVVDDDPMIHKFIHYFTKDNFKILSCYTLAEFEKVLEGEVIPAVVLMDRTLPDGDGLTACSNMKQDERYSHIPIIFLSGLATESDKVSGFFAGADDYVSKPFSSLELRARIDARLKSFNKKINIADIQINLEQQKV